MQLGDLCVVRRSMPARIGRGQTADCTSKLGDVAISNVALMLKIRLGISLVLLAAAGT
jgi:hypothetical protein